MYTQRSSLTLCALGVLLCLITPDQLYCVLIGQFICSLCLKWKEKKQRRRRQRQGGDEDRKGEGMKHTEVKSSCQRLVQERDRLGSINIASCRGWRGERCETGRGGEAKKENFSLLTVFITTKSSRALNSHQCILYLMGNSIPSGCAAL